MNVTTDRIGPIVVLQVNEPRMTFSILSEFSEAAIQLIGHGEKQIVVDLTPVNYVDSATIGCLMDLYRQATAAGGAMNNKILASCRSMVLPIVFWSGSMRRALVRRAN